MSVALVFCCGVVIIWSKIFPENKSILEQGTIRLTWSNYSNSKTVPMSCTSVENNGFQMCLGVHTSISNIYYLNILQICIMSNTYLFAKICYLIEFFKTKQKKKKTNNNDINLILCTRAKFKNKYGLFLAHAPIGCNELMAYRCVYLCIYLSIRSQLEKMPLLKYALIDFHWYFDIMIIRWGDNRGVQEIWVKGHLGIIWSCSNMLKTLLHLHDSIDFNETWVKKSLAGCSFGVFRKFWSEAVSGSLGVAFDHRVFNLLKTAAKELD